MNILFIVSGSIAAYRVFDVISCLKKDNHKISCVITNSGEKFISKFALSAILDGRVYTEFNDNLHIDLARDNNVIVVMPATANIMAKIANGIADDLATAILLTTKNKIIIVPAMNPDMWNNSFTQSNVAKLEQKVQFVYPIYGVCACNEVGVGHIADNQTIEFEIKKACHTQDLIGKKILITSGATKEYIDPVRYISNKSSGKQGSAIAENLAIRGAEVIFITGANSIKPNLPNIIEVETSQEMLTKCEEYYKNVDVAIFVAAVCDWSFGEINPHKIDKLETLTLFNTVDILATIYSKKDRPKLVIGFAAETDSNRSIERKLNKCDWLLLNNVLEFPMGGDYNKICFITNQDRQMWEKMTKLEVAKKLADLISHDDYY